MKQGEPIFGDRAVRVRQARTLHENGWTWDQVAREMGYPSARVASLRVAAYTYRQRQKTARPAPAPAVPPPPLSPDRRRGWRPRRAGELRTVGWTWRQIADELGYASEESAARCYQQAKRHESTVDERMAAVEVLRAAGWSWARIAPALSYTSLQSLRGSYLQWRQRRREAA